MIINLTSLYLTFSDNSFTSLDGLEDWNVGSLIDMSGTFAGCTNLKEVIMPNNFPKVTTTADMFYMCKSLEIIPNNMVFTEKLTDVKYMFNQCHSLPSVSISGTFENVKSSEYMFYLCKKISSISIPTNLINDTTTEKMFSGCNLLKNIPDAITFSNKLKRVNSMFASSVNLSSINIIGSFENVTTTANMFDNCPALETVSIPGNLTNTTTASYMFNNCQILNSLNDLTFGSSLTSFDHTFSSCKALSELTLNGDFSGVTTTSNMFNSATGFTNISIGDGNANFSALTNANEMFHKWPESKYDVFKDFVSQINLDIEKFPGGTPNNRVTSKEYTGRWKGGVDGDTVVTKNGLVYSMVNGYMVYWHLLPIELVSFSVLQMENDVLFSWQTKTETNNDFFSLEYSFDGLSYTTLVDIDGAGTSSKVHTYTYVWEQIPYTGLLYFRLKQTDFNGDSSYSNVIAYTIVCNPCEDNSLPQIHYGKQMFRLFRNQLIFCKGDNLN